MKKIAFYFLFLISAEVFSQSAELKAVRELYYKASENSAAADELDEKLKDQTVTESPVLYGYKGMAKLMVCYHSFNPYTKLTYFSKGKDLLEEAIKSSPENVELRFLRFSVQTNAPAFLNYNARLDEDKKQLISYLKNQNPSGDFDLYNRMKEYLLSGRHCTAEEIQYGRKLK